MGVMIGIRDPSNPHLNTDFYITYVKLMHLMSIVAKLKVNRIGGN